MSPAPLPRIAEAMRRPPLAALPPVVRGIGQVDFMASYWTGVLFIVALFVGGWQYGVFGLLGAGVATLTAYVFGAATDRIRLGLEGFPGTLIGVAFVLYLGASWVTLLLTIGGCVAGSVLTSAMNAVLTPYNLPTLTAPFCVITTVMLLASYAFQNVRRGAIHPAPPSAAHGGTALSWNDVWQGMFRGIGQIFFQDKWYVGLIFLVGLLVASRVAAVAAVLSSLLGMFVAWALGAPAAHVAAGLYGYNAVLTALAICGVFVVLSPLGVLYAAIGASAATGLTAAVTDFFLPFGGHTLTWPFVLVTWVFLAAVPVLSRLRRV
ncbi:urea transporter [Microtetraspora niveoalba]|uniref:urea transporter n=1 Tax=Microtetraspora niveoalba TaxID=46175 RepID=UPI000AC8D9A2|nr:urea transporter [Microtetraspora niveoalba]